MSAIISLQVAVNRFAAVGGATVPVDGQVTQALGTGVLNALTYLVTSMAGASATALGLIPSISNADGSANLAQITTSASGLATFLNQSADTAGVPAAPINTASLLGLTTMQAGAYGLGAVALIAAIGWLIGHKRHASSATPAMFGRRWY